MYKGIPLQMWKSEKLLDKLTAEELLELHAIMYCELLDMVEPILEKSSMLEAELIISKAMK